MKRYDKEWWAEVLYFVRACAISLALAMFFVGCVLAVLAKLDGAW